MEDRTLVGLTSEELDLVSGGQPTQNQNAVGNARGAAVGLVALGAGLAANVQLQDLAGHNNVAVAPVVIL
jgi:hypothetical protein